MSAKIISTIGPATKNRDTMRQLIKAGSSIFRINFSHGSYKSWSNIIAHCKHIRAYNKKNIKILVDLQGPKIRLGKIPTIRLRRGEKIYLTSCEASHSKYLAVQYRDLPKHVRKGDTIYLNDGRVQVKVISTDKDCNITGRVLVGGKLSANKGINIPSSKFSAATITKKDVDDLNFALKHQVDFIALSFVKDAKDIEHIRHLIDLAKPKKKPKIIAKIERKQAVKNLKEICKASDGIMVARGDLGVEIPITKLPHIQKEIIKTAHRYRKFAIVATDMLRSMENDSLPSRAEVSDIANAILDGADILMLSNETAVGQYPVEAVSIMKSTIREAQKYLF